MRQDIKTFSDITAIETRGSLRVQVKTTAHGTVKYTVQVNERYTTAVYDTNHIHYFDLLDPVSIKIKLEEFVEGTSGVEVAVAINGLEVLPKYQHLSSKQNNYIDTLDEWQLLIPANFYTWYHEITGQGWIA